ncbi:bifunctional folylpolyglutamate synthase/dihydrofolate synthase [Sphingobacterium alkalisoli]|uniref:Dihydrofolate synthase/folylpolyglutamate synthase n=1 Tax=Sphingobacterium alkalisoli TaxID=1874115 RepID=A0A4U0GYA9_9SPHI|nr:folylpolyglutamate synthase/dihydrofolate synthase family protein [Sphingobacterium alkalisoli]TJY64190.1 bifunctional folylpolyglutamate synthase/dihydrofolate synthase [Sphingobacterium alkalisoli]GGH23277.1 tetrahydrofolate synthase [Sphingobacterium alkalisoli]
MHSYTEVIACLYSRLPVFTRDGASAYKKDLDRTLELCAAIDNPQHKFKTIHVGGTNGKGSSSHMLAAILSSAGYKTGLYTSPHLIDFRERVRIDGKMIAEQFIVDYVNKHKDLIEQVNPSFFEATVALAFDYFARERVDIAIIEVGLGGRLDSTNIITPEVALITNIGLDHMDLLGGTIQEIANEKAGIIKANTPIVISEFDPIVAPIFEAKAQELQAPLLFADQIYDVVRISKEIDSQLIQVKGPSINNRLKLDLSGSYQLKNIIGVLAVVDQVRKAGFEISAKALERGLANVQQLTGFQGRWQTISTNPLIICDTGHNEDGIKEVVKNLLDVSYRKLHIVIGAMKDKDLDHMLPFLPKDATYYFSKPDMPRAMASQELREKATIYGLSGQSFDSVFHALKASKDAFQEGDLIFVGGSNFVVAEVLQSLI